MAGCPRTSDDGPATPSAPVPPPVRQVGNEARGVEAQPDYDRFADALRLRIDPDVERTLTSSGAAPCAAMYDAVLRYYEAGEGKDSAAVRHWERVRAADEASCEQWTSARAAACVRLLLDAREAEFPWLLDQCSRIYPAPEPPPEATPVPAAAAEDADVKSRAPLHLAFVGDVIFGRYRETGYDPIPDGRFAIFEEIGPLLQADVLIGNLETPLLRELPETSPIGARFQFGAPLEHARLLAEAGFTAMSLANNHWFDLREEGAIATPLLLQELGVVPLGSATMEPPHIRLETLEVEGWSLGVAAITARTNAPLRDGLPKAPYLPTDAIAETVGALFAHSPDAHDLRIVLVHWGDEYVDEPNASQMRAARALIDAGADLVIGHHPHVLQGMESYGQGLIAYSLGNFLFENTHEIPRLTGVLHVQFDDAKCLQEARFKPAYIKRLPVQHPVPALGGMARRVTTRLRETSARFRTAWTDDEHDLLVNLPPCRGAAEAKEPSGEIESPPAESSTVPAAAEAREPPAATAIVDPEASAAPKSSTAPRTGGKMTP